MRPKHGRHSYKGSKFRKRDHIFDINHMARWAWYIFLDDHPQGSHLNLSPWFGFSYKQMRKIYNAYHKSRKTEHKKRGGFCIGDQFWYATYLNTQKTDGVMIPNRLFTSFASNSCEAMSMDVD